MADLSVATANVLCTLPADRARASLRAVLDHRPDLVLLQEWSPKRLPILRETGRVRLTPGPLVGGRGDYWWVAPVLGGCVVGARADRFDLVSRRPAPLSRPGLADNPDRVADLEPPRLATLAVLRDRDTGADLSAISFHLVAGVQSRGSYRPERPLLVARHRAESARLHRLVERELASGRTVFAGGDSNFDGYAIPGLVSTWTERADEPGTFGATRKIDDIFGPSRPSGVVRIHTESDHQAVLATWS